MPHELHIRHVSELRVVLEGTLDILTLDGTHAHILRLAIRDHLAVISVLELNHLVHVCRRRCCILLHHIAGAVVLLFPRIRGHSSTGLELGLLALLVELAVLITDLEYLMQTLRWLQHLVTRRRIVLLTRRGDI